MTMSSEVKPSAHEGADRVAFRAALTVWARVAGLSFGGPAGQIAVIHRILVEEKKWISERRFLGALNYCMLLPGPEAQQLATYIGWILNGTRGALVAGILFVLPGFAAILLMSFLYAGFRDAGLVAGLFFGVKAVILAVVLDAVRRIGVRALKNSTSWSIAAAAFVSIFFLEVRFPVIIIGAGVLGFIGARLWPAHFVLAEITEFVEIVGKRVWPSWARAIKIVGIFVPLWFAPIVLMLLMFGDESVFVQLGLFFSKMAVVTFGGAYAVLAYVAQEAVQNFGWLRPGEMIDGLGLAETTPGPLIQVVQFVGFLAALRDPGSLDPWVAAVLASVLVTWVTYVPCFLWIFLGAPYMERLQGHRELSAALSAITAAMVGVILNLAVWFALNVVFAAVAEVHAFGLRLYIPALPTLDPAAAVLATAALVALLCFKTGMIPTLVGGAVLGAAYKLLT
jgi:chromate transporter